MSFLADLEIGTLTVDRLIGGAGYRFAGTEFYVDPASGSDGNNGKSPKRAKASLSAALAACTANKNDIVYLLGGSSWNVVTSTLDWNKAYTHLIGIASGSHKNRRARIRTVTSAVSPVMQFTADGCQVLNIFVSNEGTANTNLGGVYVTGQKMGFSGCHFFGAAHATPAAATGAYSLKLTGCEDSLFENCFIGDDTISRNAINRELWMTGTANARVKFKGCTFSTFSTTGANFWVQIANASIDRWVHFQDCTFINPIGSTSTILAYGMDLTTTGGTVLLDNILFYGATDLQNDNANCIIGRTPVFDTADAGLAAAQTKT